VVANFGLGKALVDLERWEEALPPLRAAIARQADYSAAYDLLAGALLRLGRTADAREVLQAGIEAATRRGDLVPLRSMTLKLKDLVAS
jgi:uncharacterized protein HemY